ncbi:MAG: hypothetical protein IT353_08115 [Gemmatimonadaceae bacterium]|nr:hypothetical protein [Gemmatimonadaceae bacterium]
MSRLLRRVLRQRITTACVTAFLLQACGGEDPQVPTTFTPSGSAATQITASVATEVPVAPQVQILDAKGRGIAKVRVRWRVGTNSGGVGNDSTVTDASGVARSGGWTLGTVAGTQTLTAVADGVSPVTFTANVAPGPAAGFVRLSPTTQQATVNTAVAQAPSVRAEDLFGNVVPGLAVTFSVATGGGTMDGATQTTNQDGVATAGAWRLGTGVGQQLARVTAPNVPQASFSATAIAGPAAALVKIVGDNQDAIPGFTIDINPGVRVTDAFGNPVGNVPVTFTPGPNSGTVTNGVVTSDGATGNAFVGSWTVGPGPNPTLVATSSALPGVSATFNATIVNSNFTISVRYVGETPSLGQQQAFARAVAKWRTVIVARSGESRQVLSPGSCGRSWMPSLDSVITNVVIFANIGPIDGVGSVLGNANLCRLHGNGLAAVGTMLFDSADLTSLESQGLLDAVILHEIGHVLGIGTLWSASGFLQDEGGADPIFTGPQTLTQFLALGGATYTGRPVPVENSGGAGTRDSHWRESVLRNELMTGFVNQGQNPLSRMTVGSLRDLGYQTSFSGADNFAVPTPAFAARALGTGVSLGNDIAPIPADERARAGLDRPLIDRRR